MRISRGSDGRIEETCMGKRWDTRELGDESFEISERISAVGSGLGIKAEYRGGELCKRSAGIGELRNGLPEVLVIDKKEIYRVKFLCRRKNRYVWMSKGMNSTGNQSRYECDVKDEGIE
jgi:hypothetical protein